MTIPLDFRRTAKPCPFKTFRYPATPAVSTLAHHSPNPFPCLSSRPQGGGSPWSNQLAPTSCLSRQRKGRQPFRILSGPAGCRRYSSTERDGPFGRTQGKQAHPLQRQQAADQASWATVLSPTGRCAPATSISSISPAYEPQPRMSLVSPTYAKTGGVPPHKNVGAPTFLIFPLISRTLLALRAAEGPAPLVA
jgi:hypothetical protein